MDNPKDFTSRFGHPTTNMYQKPDQQQQFWGQSPQNQFSPPPTQYRPPGGGFGGQVPTSAYQNNYGYQNFDQRDDFLFPMANQDAKYHNSREFFNVEQRSPTSDYTELQPSELKSPEPIEEAESEPESENSTTTENTDKDPDYAPGGRSTKPKPMSTRQHRKRREPSETSIDSVDSEVQDIKARAPAGPHRTLSKKQKKNEFVPKARGYKPKSQMERDDPSYRAKREKNNDAVRKSRFKAKMAQDGKQAETQKVMERNVVLEVLLKEKDREIAQLKAKLRAFETGAAQPLGSR